MGDPRAIFGGLVITNFEIQEEEAEILMTYGVKKGHRILDGIIAPAYSEAAFGILKKRVKCRLVVNTALATDYITKIDDQTRFRYGRGTILVQSNYNFVLDFNELTLHNRTLSDGDKSNLLLAWAIGCTSNSNTVTLVKNNYLIGNGTGQQDRVGCCELAVKRARDAKHDINDAVAYSDSFFPFEDGPEVLMVAGINVILSSSGSIRDKKIISFCKNSGVNLCMIPDHISRGFFGH